MYQLARYNNITPIATTLYFDNTHKSQTENVIALNTWIKIYSWKNKNPVVDFNKRFADNQPPGNQTPHSSRMTACTQTRRDSGRWQTLFTIKYLP